MSFEIIKEFVIILLISIPTVLLFKKIRISPIIGFLIAGVIIGPFGFKLINDYSRIDVMAEIGVILLMFTIGLEFSIEKMIKIRKVLLFAGGLQVLLTVLISAVLFYLIGFPIRNSVFFGMLISLSSTAIVMKIFVDRNELDSPHGKISVAILIFQDLAILPMIVLLPVIGSSEPLSFSQILIKLLSSVLIVLFILFVSRFIVSKILYQIAKTRVREVFTIGVLLLILGTAYMTELAGMTLSIGAFIAGLIISESVFSSEISAEILPFKDAFNSIFFISIGLLLDFYFVVNNLGVLLLIVVTIIAIKSIVVIGVVATMKYPLRTGTLTALSIAQVGEFSFVLVKAADKYSLIQNEYYNAFIAGSILSMILTPFLIEIAPYIASRLPVLRHNFVDGGEKSLLNNHVIIVGFGLNGRNLVKVLKETGIPYLVVELNPETVVNCKNSDINIIYGDITKREILLHAGIENAKGIVYAISDPNSTRISVQLARQINSKIFIIVRTRYFSEVSEVKKLGADEVIPEEFETSLQIFNHVLTKYHIPLNVIMKQISIMRNESYSIFRDDTGHSSKLLHIDELLAAGLTETFYVNIDNPNIGKTIGELDLRAKTGATVIAIVRENSTVTNPSANDILKAKDTIVITGNHKSVDAAINMLDNG